MEILHTLVGFKLSVIFFKNRGDGFIFIAALKIAHRTAQACELT